ncbi:hypothetical protein JXB31_02875 [Candidatus Woesearchaeota archaeon]|nr:hypothetical protein [Candidatus Woesearchaeota archaeon]
MKEQPKDKGIVKKAAAIAFLLIAVSAMLGLAFGRISAKEFWLTTLFCAAFAWLVLPKLK